MKSAKGSKVLRRLLSHIFSYRKDSSILILSVAIAAVAGAFYPLVIGYAVDNIISGRLIFLVTYALLFLVLYFITFLANRVRTLKSTKLAQISVKYLRDSAFKNLQKVPVDFYGKVKTGYLISRISNDAESLGDFLTFQLPQVVSGIATVIISVAVMAYLDFPLMLYALIIIPVMVGFTFSMQGRVRRNYLRTRRTIAAITGNLAENISAMRSIKSFNVEEPTYERFDVLNQDNLKANVKAARLSSFYGATVAFMEAVGIAIVIIAGSLQLISGIATVGILVSFIIYVQEFFDPVTSLSQLYTSYQSAAVGLVRIYGIIDSPQEVVKDPVIRDLSDWNELSFNEVSFAYGDNYALKDINLKIKKGEKIAIVGHTGAGKTTLSNMVMRFYSPQKGSITLDGSKLDDINIESWRKLVSPVLQDPFLFRGTVIENIQFSKPDATDDYIIQLSMKYGLKEIFDSLPEGIYTNVGEMGRNLSEGQRQAISVMRAFIRESPIIILDEPTSQIDPISEKIIISALKDYLKSKTLILITHRFSMVSLADKIVVIDQGRIVDTGKFNDLLSREGVFSELYHLQYGP
ncbi:MAG: ABC transporter ATP-binding protein/permease [Candidatus Thermoplasmatota archaeon]|nr:ABC transporter ATP-binding protein/permease [Candidatus Thermoplasmatota archaeon]